MKKFLVVSFAVVALLFAREASASTIQFNLDCILTATTCTAGGPGGYIKLTDNGNNIDVEVSVNSALSILLVSFNWANGALPGTAFTATGATVNVALNATNPFGRFDIRVIDTAPIGNPLLFTLSNSGYGNLDPEFFLAKDTLNQVYGAVRMTDDGGPVYGASTVAPEPATLALLGIGLSAAALAVRRRKA